MKIAVNEDNELELSELYTGVAIKTDVGTFAVCQRDGGIEIRLNDGPWHRWVGPEPEKLPCPS